MSKKKWKKQNRLSRVTIGTKGSSPPQSSPPKISTRPPGTPPTVRASAPPSAPRSVPVEDEYGPVVAVSVQEIANAIPLSFGGGYEDPSALAEYIPPSKLRKTAAQKQKLEDQQRKNVPQQTATAPVPIPRQLSSPKIVVKKQQQASPKERKPKSNAVNKNKAKPSPTLTKKSTGHRMIIRKDRILVKIHNENDWMWVQAVVSLNATILLLDVYTNNVIRKFHLTAASVYPIDKKTGKKLNSKKPPSTVPSGCVFHKNAAIFTVRFKSKKKLLHFWSCPEEINAWMKDIQDMTAPRPKAEKENRALRRLDETARSTGAINGMLKDIGVGALDKNRWKIAEEDLTTLNEIGQGAFGVVYVGRYKLETVVIKKCTQKDEKANESFIRECVTMVDMKPHPNVVQIYGVCIHQNSLECDMVMEHVQFGSLDTVLYGNTPLNEKTIWHFLKGIIEGIIHIHNANLVHCDIAARNVLIGRDDVPKISDFGMSRSFSRKGTEQIEGDGKYAIRWMSPEAIDKIFTPQSDIWAFGVLMYEVLVREKPHLGIPINDLCIMIRDDALRPSIPDGVWVNAEYRRIMDLCWQKEPKDRQKLSTTLLTLKKHQKQFY
mmetsp:Transcript_21949/g.24523  ORF Transcript_21949/g.24523 Transcript_21949/m.24523 type:complete len:604 (+) Transcript_21949:240-2051(+)